MSMHMWEAFDELNEEFSSTESSAMAVINKIINDKNMVSMVLTSCWQSNAQLESTIRQIRSDQEIKNLINLLQKEAQKYTSNEDDYKKMLNLDNLIYQVTFNQPDDIYFTVTRDGKEFIEKNKIYKYIGQTSTSFKQRDIGHWTSIFKGLPNSLDLNIKEMSNNKNIKLVNKNDLRFDTANDQTRVHATVRALAIMAAQVDPIGYSENRAKTYADLGIWLSKLCHAHFELLAKLPDGFLLNQKAHSEVLDLDFDGADLQAILLNILEIYWINTNNTFSKPSHDMILTESGLNSTIGGSGIKRYTDNAMPLDWIQSFRALVSSRYPLMNNTNYSTIKAIKLNNRTANINSSQKLDYDLLFEIRQNNEKTRQDLLKKIEGYISIDSDDSAYEIFKKLKRIVPELISSNIEKETTFNSYLNEHPGDQRHVSKIFSLLESKENIALIHPFELEKNSEKTLAWSWLFDLFYRVWSKYHIKEVISDSKKSINATEAWEPFICSLAIILDSNADPEYKTHLSYFISQNLVKIDDTDSSIWNEVKTNQDWLNFLIKHEINPFAEIIEALQAELINLESSQYYWTILNLHPDKLVKYDLTNFRTNISKTYVKLDNTVYTMRNFINGNFDTKKAYSNILAWEQLKLLIQKNYQENRDEYLKIVKDCCSIDSYFKNINDKITDIDRKIWTYLKQNLKLDDKNSYYLEAIKDEFPEDYSRLKNKKEYRNQLINLYLSKIYFNNKSIKTDILEAAKDYNKIMTDQVLKAKDIFITQLYNWIPSLAKEPIPIFNVLSKDTEQLAIIFCALLKNYELSIKKTDTTYKAFKILTESVSKIKIKESEYERVLENINAEFYNKYTDVNIDSLIFKIVYYHFDDLDFKVQITALDKDLLVKKDSLIEFWDNFF